jgi:nucleoside-diphosphate-sugar epimerase
MNKCIVTGGAGFIGSHIARKLVNDGNQVIVIDNMSEGRIENIADFQDKVDFCKEDILNLGFLQKKFKGVDHIFHQAALRSVERSVDKPQETNQVNIEGTLNVLLAARDNKVKRVIFASSSSVYGDQPHFAKASRGKPFEESMCPNPVSPYALTKLCGEIYLRQFYQLYGLETISLRYFNVFGPFQDPSNEYANVIPIFITKLKKNETPTIHWDGEQSRDFNFIDDVIRANILAMKAKKTKGEVLNICDGKNYSINQMYKMLCQIMKKNIKPKYGPKRAGDVRTTLGNPDKAEKILSFKAKVGFKQGLEKTVDWFKKN